MYQLTTSEAFNQNIQKLVGLLYYSIHKGIRHAPNVTVTLTRQNLEAAFYCSKNDRLHVLQIVLLILIQKTYQFTMLLMA